MEDNTSMTLEDEFSERHRWEEYYYRRLAELQSSLDFFLAYTKAIEYDNTTERTCYETLGALLRLELDIDSAMRVANSYRGMGRCRQLLQSSKSKPTDLKERFIRINDAVGVCAAFRAAGSKSDFAEPSLEKVAETLASNGVALLKYLPSQIECFEAYGLVYKERFFVREKAEIEDLWNECLSRYEKDRALFFTSFFEEVYSISEALNELKSVRESNKIINQWHAMRDPNKFIRELRKRGDAVELDLLPVFEYEIKYKRLQEMRKDEPPKRSANMDNSSLNIHITNQAGGTVQMTDQQIINKNI